MLGDVACPVARGQKDKLVGGLPYRAAMTRFVIDAATLLHLVQENVPIIPQHQIVAPSLIRSQALSLLLQRARRGDLTESVALQHLERIAEMKMRLLGDRVSRRTAWKIARERSWETTYEAEYVAVTRLQADALISVDGLMRNQVAGMVPLAHVDALTAA